MRKYVMFGQIHGKFINFYDDFFLFILKVMDIVQLSLQWH